MGTYLGVCGCLHLLEESLVIKYNSKDQEKLSRHTDVGCLGIQSTEDA